MKREQGYELFGRGYGLNEVSSSVVREVYGSCVRSAVGESPLDY